MVVCTPAVIQALSAMMRMIMLNKMIISAFIALAVLSGLARSDNNGVFDSLNNNLTMQMNFDSIIDNTGRISFDKIPPLIDTNFEVLLTRMIEKHGIDKIKNIIDNRLPGLNKIIGKGVEVLRNVVADESNKTLNFELVKRPISGLDDIYSYRECEPFEIYNKYETDVMVLVLSDSSGKDMNKKVYNSGNNFALHGFWPRDVCLGYSGTTDTKLNFGLLVDGMYEIELHEKFTDASNLMNYSFSVDFTKGRKNFYLREYKKHFLSSYYSFESFAENFDKFNGMLGNTGLGKFPFVAHECRFNKTLGVNFVLQIAHIMGEPKNYNREHTCVMGKPFSFYNFNGQNETFGEVFYFNGHYFSNSPFNSSSLKDEFIYSVKKHINVYFRTLINSNENVVYYAKKYVMSSVNVLFLWIISFYNSMKSKWRVGDDILDKKRYVNLFFNFIMILAYLAPLPMICITSGGYDSTPFGITIASVLAFCFYLIKYFYEYDLIRAIFQLVSVFFCWALYYFLISNEYVDKMVVGGVDISYFSKFYESLQAWLIEFHVCVIVYFMPVVLTYFALSRAVGYFKKVYKSVNSSKLIDESGWTRICKLVTGKLFDKIFVFLFFWSFSSGSLIIKPVAGVNVFGDIGIVYSIFSTFLLSYSCELATRLLGLKQRSIYFCEILILSSFGFHYYNVFEKLFSILVSNDYHISLTFTGSLISASLLIFACFNKCFLSMEFSFTTVLLETFCIFDLLCGLFSVNKFGLSKNLDDILEFLKFPFERYIFVVILAFFIVFVISYVFHKNLITVYGIKRGPRGNVFYEKNIGFSVFADVVSTLCCYFFMLFLLDICWGVVTPSFKGKFYVESEISWTIAFVMVIASTLFMIFSTRYIYAFYKFTYHYDFKEYYYQKLYVQFVCVIFATAMVSLTLLLTYSTYFYMAYAKFWLDQLTAFIPFIAFTFFVNMIFAYVSPMVLSLKNKILLVCDNYFARSAFESGFRVYFLLQNIAFLILKFFSVFSLLTSLYKSVFNLLSVGRVYDLTSNLMMVPMAFFVVLVGFEMCFGLYELAISYIFDGNSIKFNKKYSYRRENADLCRRIKANSNIDYLREEVEDPEEYDVNMSRLDILKRGRTVERQVKRKTVRNGPVQSDRTTTVEPNTAETETFERRHVRGGRNNRQEDPGDDLDLIRRQRSTQNHGQSVSRNTVAQHQTRHIEYEHVFDYNSDTNNLEEFELFTTSRFVLDQVKFGIVNTLETADNVRLISSEDFDKVKNSIEEPSVYCPVAKLLNNELAKCNIENFFSARYTGIEESKSMCDVVSKAPSLMALAGEYYNVDTIEVYQESSNLLEFGMVFEGFFAGPIIKACMSFLCGLFGKVNTDMSRLSAIHLTSWLTSLNELTFCSTVFEKDSIISLDDYIIHLSGGFNSLVKDIKDKKIYMFVSYTGQVYLTQDAAVSMNICTEKVYGHMGTYDYKFSPFNYEVLSSSTRVRPFHFNNNFTLSTRAHAGDLSVDVKCGTEILHCPDFDMFLTPSMDIYSFKINDRVSSISKNKLLMGVLACSSGLVYCSTIKSDTHIGTASLFINDAGKLKIITNQHVVQGWDSDVTVTYGKGVYAGQKTFNYRSGLIYKTLFLGSIITLQMDNLESIGNDFAIFSVDDEDRIYGLLGKSGASKKDIKSWFPKLSGLKNATELLVSCSRQVNNLLTSQKGSILFRNVVTKFDDQNEMYFVLGYSTPGLSGSPIYRFVDGGVELVALMSAMEATGKACVNATRLIDAGKIEKIYKSGKVTNGRLSLTCDSCDAIAPCWTEKVKSQMDRRYMFLNGSHEISDRSQKVEWYSSGDWPEIVGDYLLTSLEGECRPYWKIYQDNLPMFEFDCAKYDIDDLVDCLPINNDSLPNTDSYLKIKIHKGKRSSGMNFGEAESMLRLVKEGKYPGIHIVDTFSSNKNYALTLENDGFWNFKSKIDETTVSSTCVDDIWILEFLSNLNNNNGQFERIISVLGNHTNMNEVITVYKIGEKLYVDSKKKSFNNLEKCAIINCNNLEVFDDEIVSYKNSMWESFLDESEPSIGFCTLSKEQLEEIKANKSEFIKKYSEELVQLRKKQKLVGDAIKELRQKLTDFRQSYDYKEKKREYDSVIGEYRKQLEEINFDKDKIPKIKKQMKDSIKLIEEKYNKIIAEKRQESKDITMKQKDIREKYKQKNQNIKDQLEKRIKDCKDKMVLLKERINKYQKQITLGFQADIYKKLIDTAEDEKKQINEQINKLVEEKNEEIKKEKDSHLKNIPEYPPKPEVQNPDMSPKVIEMQEELRELRRQMKELKDGENSVHKTIEEVKQSNSHIQTIVGSSFCSCPDIEKIKEQTKENVKEMLVDFFKSFVEEYKQGLDKKVEERIKAFEERFMRSYQQQTSLTDDLSQTIKDLNRKITEIDCKLGDIDSEVRRRKKNIQKEYEQIEDDEFNKDYDEKVPKQVKKTSAELEFDQENRRRAKKQVKDREVIDLEDEDEKIQSERILPKKIQKPNALFSEVVKRVNSQPSRQLFGNGRTYNRDSGLRPVDTSEYEQITFTKISEMKEDDINCFRSPFMTKKCLAKWNMVLTQFENKEECKQQFRCIKCRKVLNVEIKTVDELKNFFEFLNKLVEGKTWPNGNKFTVYRTRFDEIVNGDGKKRIAGVFQSSAYLNFDVFEKDDIDCKNNIATGQLIVSFADSDRINRCRADFNRKVAEGYQFGGLVGSVNVFKKGEWTEQITKFFVKVGQLSNANFLKRGWTIEEWKEKAHIITNIVDNGKKVTDSDNFLYVLRTLRPQQK